MHIGHTLRGRAPHECIVVDERRLAGVEYGLRESACHTATTKSDQYHNQLLSDILMYHE
jgi:hypothetical protein